MRYLLLEFKEKRPSDRDLIAQVSKALGQLGLAESQFRIIDELIACDRKWVDRVLAALALKWQFRTKKISGTIKKARA